MIRNPNQKLPEVLDGASQGFEPEHTVYLHEQATRVAPAKFLMPRVLGATYVESDEIPELQTVLAVAAKDADGLSAAVCQNALRTFLGAPELTVQHITTGSDPSRGGHFSTVGVFPTGEPHSDLPEVQEPSQLNQVLTA